MHIVSEGPPEYFTSDRIHFLNQVCELFVDHSVCHPVHMVKERGNCDWDGTVIDGAEHGTVYEDQLVFLWDRERGSGERAGRQREIV